MDNLASERVRSQPEKAGNRITASTGADDVVEIFLEAGMTRFYQALLTTWGTHELEGGSAISSFYF